MPVEVLPHLPCDDQGCRRRSSRACSIGGLPGRGDNGLSGPRATARGLNNLVLFVVPVRRRMDWVPCFRRSLAPTLTRVPTRRKHAATLTIQAHRTTVQDKGSSDVS